MKLTKLKLKQLIREALKEGYEDEPTINISTGDVRREPTGDPVEDIIDKYSTRSAKPELIKRMLEVVREFSEDLPLDENDLNLIEDAGREMERYLKDEDPADGPTQPTTDARLKASLGPGGAPSAYERWPIFGAPRTKE